jgi:small conductance mechanosensitive channel
MEKEMETLTRFIDTVVQFAVAYGFQILGALVFLLIGLKIAGWAGAKVAKMAERKDLDVTLGKFIGNVVKLVVVVFVVIITLGNFGITIAPLIALAGASAFGATLAIQGPLSNYGAGLAIILARPFVVGNTITVRNTSGVVDEVKLAATVLVGEDGERITVPNKQIVGEVLTNSHGHRVVQSKLCIGADADAGRAVEVLRRALADIPELAGGPAPQAGIHDFTYGGIVIGLRFWVPSQRYFQVRYAVNQKALAALAAASIPLITAAPAAVAAAPLSADDEDDEG